MPRDIQSDVDEFGNPLPSKYSQTQGYGMVPVYAQQGRMSERFDDFGQPLKPAFLGYEFNPIAAGLTTVDVPKPAAILAEEKRIGKPMEATYATFTEPMSGGDRGQRESIAYGPPTGYRYDNGQSQYVKFDSSGNYYETEQRKGDNDNLLKLAALFAAIASGGASLGLGETAALGAGQVAAAAPLAFTPEMIAAGMTPGSIGAAGAVANVLTDAQLAALYGVNSGIATLAPTLSQLPSGPPSTPGTPPPPGLEPPIPSGIETLPSGPPGTPGTPPPPPSGIETLPSGPPSTPGTPPPPNLEPPVPLEPQYPYQPPLETPPIEEPIPSGPPSTPGTPPPPNLELPTPPEPPIPAGPPSTPGTPPPPNVELPTPIESPLPSGPPSTPGTPPPPNLEPPGPPPKLTPAGIDSLTNTPGYGKSAAAAAAAASAGLDPNNVGLNADLPFPGVNPTPGIGDLLKKVKDKVLGSSDSSSGSGGMGLGGVLGLMALMSMMNKGGGGTPASTATIPELTATRSQLPYDVNKTGVNPNTPYRPGQGGVSYFSPTTYTPKAAGGGLMSLGQSNLGGYSDGGRLLQGPGDGVSDSIPAIIGRKQPARLANGEFVIPARIVSELGNGSTDAGAKRLYEMMDRVQSVRRKTKNVAANTKAAKYLPA